MLQPKKKKERAREIQRGFSMYDPHIREPNNNSHPVNVRRQKKIPEKPEICGWDNTDQNDY